VGPQTFRSVSAVIVWWVWVLFALGNLIDLAVQGRDHLAVLAAAILLLVTGVAYVTAQRPRVISTNEGITVRNPLRDHRIPWPLVVRVDLADLLRVHTRPSGAGDGSGDGAGQGKVISAWAVHYSRRRKITSDMRQRRSATRVPRGARVGGGLNNPFGMPSPSYGSRPGPTADTSPEAEAERIARLLNDRATAAGIEEATAAAEQSAGERLPRERVMSTWSWPALVALGVPALIVLIVALI
jgi:hypothetical protein